MIYFRENSIEEAYHHGQKANFPLYHQIQGYMYYQGIESCGNVYCLERQLAPITQ